MSMEIDYQNGKNGDRLDQNGTIFGHLMAELQSFSSLWFYWEFSLLLFKTWIFYLNSGSLIIISAMESRKNRNLMAPRGRSSASRTAADDAPCMYNSHMIWFLLNHPACIAYCRLEDPSVLLPIVVSCSIVSFFGNDTDGWTRPGGARACNH